MHTSLPFTPDVYARHGRTQSTGAHFFQEPAFSTDIGVLDYQKRNMNALKDLTAANYLKSKTVINKIYESHDVHKLTNGDLEKLKNLG